MLKKRKTPIKQIFIVAVIGLISSIAIEFGLIKTQIPSIIISVGISLALFELIILYRYVVIRKR
jgi:protein-S-isoprenylcysteine O-methyltransferase Ste14